MFKSGFVSIYGNPNAGKSTLFNKLIGEKISIISHKIQTTRKNLKGILNEKNYQIIFIDTPGFISRTRYELHKKMNNEISMAKQSSDISLLLFDVNNNFKDLNELASKNKFKTPLILALNKIDSISKNDLELRMKEIENKEQYNKIVCISSIKEKKLNTLVDALVEYLPQNPPYFTEDDITDTNTRNIVSEFIREKIFHLYQKEIPYSSAVLINEYKEYDDIITIKADIIVQKKQQKIIIIGANGNAIKQVGINARLEIEKLVNKKVYLELFVKVRHNWINNHLYLKEFGY